MNRQTGASRGAPRGEARKYRRRTSDERSTADVFIINGDDAFAVQEAKNLIGQGPAKVVHVRKEAKGLNGHLS
jgi:hypothetical protein